MRGVVNSSDAIGEEVCDSDGEVIGQESTIFAVFEFISVLGEGRKFQRLLPPILPQLIYYLIAHMQITEAQVCNCITELVDSDSRDCLNTLTVHCYSKSVAFNAVQLV